VCSHFGSIVGQVRSISAGPAGKKLDNYEFLKSNAQRVILDRGFSIARDQLVLFKCS
jgi:hypothetical protein